MTVFVGVASFVSCSRFDVKLSVGFGKSLFELFGTTDEEMNSNVGPLASSALLVVLRG